MSVNLNRVGSSYTGAGSASTLTGDTSGIDLNGRKLYVGDVAYSA